MSPSSPRVGYVLKMYPRFSETFIVSEILAREAAGEEIVIFSLRPPIDARFHPELARVQAPVGELVRAGERVVVEREQLLDPCEVEEPVAADVSRDAPEEEPHEHPGGQHGTVPRDFVVIHHKVPLTTAHDAERIQDVRRASRALVTIGACATAGGVQALRNFADVREFVAAVYASPEYISTLATSTAIATHV